MTFKMWEDRGVGIMNTMGITHHTLVAAANRKTVGRFDEQHGEHRLTGKVLWFSDPDKYQIDVWLSQSLTERSPVVKTHFQVDFPDPPRATHSKFWNMEDWDFDVVVLGVEGKEEGQKVLQTHEDLIAPCIEQGFEMLRTDWFFRGV